MSFQVCRICFTPNCIADLSSLFEGDAKKAEMFEKLTGIDIFKDQGRNDALICSNCSPKLGEAFELREKARKLEENIFASIRHEVEKSDEIVENSPKKGKLDMHSLINKTVFVGWPHLSEAKVVKVSDRELTTSSDGSTDKTDPNQFRQDATAIREHHSGRMGIDVGEIECIVHVLPASGDDYRFDPAKKVFRLHKTYAANSVAYPAQCIVTDVKAYRKKFEPELTLFEAFKNGTEVFMLTNPYYGAFGEVTDVNCAEKNGRVQVLLTVPQEPNFDGLWELHERSRGAYMNGYQSAAALGIGDGVFNRITGTVLVVSGSKRELGGDSAKINVGLQLKFPKHNEEVAGFTRKDRVWLYSERVVELVQEYYRRYPVVFEVLGRKSGGNDIFFESELFGESATLQELTKWLAALPHQKAERRQVGTESLEADVVEAAKAKAADAAKEPFKKITMQVKPHLLFAPSLASTADAPDKAANFQLFDRVVVAKDSEKLSVGDRGTVVGVSRIKDLNPVRRDCVNKEDLYCDVLFDQRREVVRLIAENLINLSYGARNGSQNQVEDDAVEEKSRKNFAETWKFLKQGGHVRTSFQSRFKPSSNAVPHIAAPKTLPAPPAEWIDAPYGNFFENFKAKHANHEDYGFFQMGMYVNWSHQQNVVTDCNNNELPNAVHCKTPLKPNVFVPLQVTRNAVKMKALKKV